MTKTKPKGKIAIQTLAMPSDTNPYGDIFGGWIVSQMDLAGGVLAKRVANGRIVTVAINSMVFYKPVHVGDLITCHADLEKIGNTSMTIKLEVWCNSHMAAKRQKVTDGVFVYVAVDDNGKPRPVRK